MDQAIARAVRMGQTQVVQVYHLRLEAENDKTINIDAAITAKADTKRDMLNDLFKMAHKPTAVEIAQELVSGMIYAAMNPAINLL
jgi:SNF2 family DNA or RNA helicase